MLGQFVNCKGHAQHDAVLQSASAGKCALKILLGTRNCAGRAIAQWQCIQYPIMAPFNLPFRLFYMHDSREPECNVVLETPHMNCDARPLSPNAEGLSTFWETHRLLILILPLVLMESCALAPIIPISNLFKKSFFGSNERAALMSSFFDTGGNLLV